ncbi:MAG: hypothetical protein IH624_01630, partial [Phycisphaerae bacterium]|nr:hypothetical protein [Phycisphaerae bacterium]
MSGLVAIRRGYGLFGLWAMVLLAGVFCGGVEAQDAAGGKVLWEIGVQDNDTAEFALGRAG